MRHRPILAALLAAAAVALVGAQASSADRGHGQGHGKGHGGKLVFVRRTSSPVTGSPSTAAVTMVA